MYWQYTTPRASSVPAATNPAISADNPIKTFIFASINSSSFKGYETVLAGI
jgi:hypothetical protein